MLAKLFSNKTLCLTTPEVDLAFDYDSMGEDAYAMSLGVKPKQLDGDIFTLIGILGGDQAATDARNLMGDGLADVMGFLNFENGRVSFGDVVAFAYDNLRLILESDSNTDGLTKRNFCIEVTGQLSLSYSDFFPSVDDQSADTQPTNSQSIKLAGILRINMGNMGFAPVSFQPDESANQLPSELRIPMFGIDEDLLLVPDIQSMAVVSEGEANAKKLAIQFVGTLALSGGPKAIQRENNAPHLLPLKLSYKDDILRLASPLLISVLDINLQEVLNIDANLGTLGLDVGNLNINLPTDGITPMSCTVELHCRLPEALNNILPGLNFINVYDPQHPDTSTFKIRLGFNQLGLQTELISSPFKAYSSGDDHISSELRVDNELGGERLWWNIKLADVGHIEMMSPIFSSNSVTGAMYGKGAFKIIEPLSLPFNRIKALLSDHGLSALASLLPGNISLPMEENGEPVALGLDSFGQLGKLLDGVLSTVGLDIKEFMKLLPDRMKEFGSVSLPSEFSYQFNFDPKGSCTGSIKLPAGKPLKLLLPAGPTLYGIELRELSLGQYKGGKLGVLEVDGSIDLFMLPEIVASMAASAANVPMLPASKTLITQLKIDKLLALIDFKKAAIQPVFFNELALSRIGFEGFELMSKWQLPKPAPDILALAQFISPLVDFVTDKDSLLDASVTNNPFDTYFEIGENYLQLPQYFGGTVLGSKGSEILRIEAQDLWPYIAHSLNFIKTGQVNELLACVPIDYRIGHQSVNFFGLANIDVNYLISSPSELAEVGFDKLNLDEKEKSRALSVLPGSITDSGSNNQADGNGLVALLRGEVNVANAIKLSVIQGFAMTESGVHCGFNVNGQLAQLFAIDIEGGVSLNTKPTASIMLNGKTCWSLAGHPVMIGTIAIQNDNLYLSGELDLFPYLPQVDLSAFIEGELSSSSFTLNGNLNFSLFGLNLLKGGLTITPNKAELTVNILGKKQCLGIAEHQGGMKLSGIHFNSFGLVDTIADVAISLDDVEMRINGVSRMTLPDKAVLPIPVAYAEMDLDSSMRLADGVIKVDGKVNSNSYVLAGDCRLKGDFAYYAWMNSEQRGDFVFSLGGYHPKFNRPAHYPKLSPLEFGWKLKKNLSLKGKMYAALTPACIMAGGQLKATFKTGPLKAGFKANANFIMAWQPFYYEAELSVDVYASVRLKVDFGLFTASVKFSTSVGVDLDIWGPDFAGRATIDWDVFKFSIKFGPKKKQNKNGISWDSFKEKYIPNLAQSEFIGLSIESGQIGSINGWLVVDPDQLELSCKSPLPINSLALKPMDRAAANRDFIKSGNRFNLAPQKAKPINNWSVVVNYSTATDPGFKDIKKGMYFEGETINKNFPKAVWGKDFIPSLKNSSHAMIPLLNGVRIVAANGKPPGFTEALDADEFKYQDLIENDPYWEWGNALLPIVIKDDATNLSTIIARLSEAASAIERENIANFFDCDETLNVEPLHQDIQSAFIGIPQVLAR